MNPAWYCGRMQNRRWGYLQTFGSTASRGCEIPSSDVLLGVAMKPSVPPKPWDLGGPARALVHAEGRRVRARGGPGTGKTLALLQRAGRVLSEGVEPGRIVFFVRHPAEASELRRSLTAWGVEKASELPIKTLHEHCIEVLRRPAVLRETGLLPRLLAPWEIEVMFLDFGEFGGLRDCQRNLDTCLRLWAAGEVDEGLEGSLHGVLRSFAENLRRWLRWHGAMLSDEVIPQVLRYLRQHPNSGEAREFEHVLVDDYQELSLAAQEVVEALALHGQLNIAGDAQQQVESRAYAHPQGVETFAADEDVLLEQAPRLPAALNAYAAEVVRSSPQAIDPERRSEALVEMAYETHEDEAEGIAAWISEGIDTGKFQPGECALLTNSGELAAGLVEALSRRGVPAASYFPESSTMSDERRAALSLLLLDLDPEDRVALRTWMSVGVSDGRGSAYERLRELAEQRGVSVSQLIHEPSLQVPGAVPYTKQLMLRWQELARRREELTPHRTSPARWLQALFPAAESAGLRQRLVEAFDANDSLQIAEGWAWRIAQALLSPALPSRAPLVRIAPYHAAKELQCKWLVLARSVDGLMPEAHVATGLNERQHREVQRAMFYVAMTRASEGLVLSHFRSIPLHEAKHLGIRVARTYHQEGKFRAETRPCPFLYR